MAPVGDCTMFLAGTSHLVDYETVTSNSKSAKISPTPSASVLLELMLTTL
jgi:hypothetical protein